MKMVVAKDINIKIRVKVKIKKNLLIALKKIESVDNEYIDIYNLIPYYPVSIEYLARKSDLRISEINQKLTMLELQALIKSLPGNNYVRI